MTDTKTLITRLSSEVKAIKPLPYPLYSGMRLIAVLALYGGSTQFFLGLRPDLALQFTRPGFVTEIGLLIALLLTSVIASVLVMAPDNYQKPTFLKLPYLVFLLLSSLMLAQLFLPPDSRMVMPEVKHHTIECALCIAMVALIPSAIAFTLLRKGASVHPYQAGSFVMLAAGSIGCLTLRLSEAIDSIQHLLIWHYIPTIVFAIIGAYIGKWLLKW